MHVRMTFYFYWINDMEQKINFDKNIYEKLY